MNDAERELTVVVRQTILWARGETVHNPHFILPMLIEAIREMENDPILLRNCYSLPDGAIQMIIDTVFERNIINWGRLVSVFAFCARVARLNKNRSNFLLKFEYDIGKALTVNTRAWFDNHNGWRGFQSFMNNHKQKKIIDLSLIGLMIVMSMFLIYTFVKK